MESKGYTVIGMESKRSLKVLNAKLQAEKTENNALRQRLDDTRKQTLEIELTCKKKCKDIESKRNWEACEHREDIISKTFEIDALTQQNDDLHKEKLELQLELQLQSKKQLKLSKVVEQKTHLVNKHLKVLKSHISAFKTDNDELRKRNLELELRLCKDSESRGEASEANDIFSNLSDTEGEKNGGKLKPPELKLRSLTKENMLLRARNSKMQKQILELQMNIQHNPNNSRSKVVHVSLLNKVQMLKIKLLEKYEKMVEKAEKVERVEKVNVKK